MASVAVLASPDTRSFAYADVIYHQGDPAPTPFIVQCGVVQVVASSREGRQGVTAIAGPGDLFGEDALSGGARTGRASALADGTTIRSAPGDQAPLVAALAERSRVVTLSLQALLLHRASPRIAAQLADLARRHGVPERGGILIPFSLTQEQIALMAGTTRETANRALRDFERAGWIRMLKRRRVLVTDLDAMSDGPQISARGLR
jgi:CRP-like cAMP-binding protein